jgi:hypothetical protein
MLFVRVYPCETQEMVFDAHDRAFAGTAPRSGLEQSNVRGGVPPTKTRPEQTTRLKYYRASWLSLPIPRQQDNLSNYNYVACVMQIPPSVAAAQASHNLSVHQS